MIVSFRVLEEGFCRYRNGYRASESECSGDEQSRPIFMDDQTASSGGSPRGEGRSPDERNTPVITMCIADRFVCFAQLRRARTCSATGYLERF